VVGDNGEAPALNNEAEVADPLHAGQKLSIKSIPLDLRGSNFLQKILAAASMLTQAVDAAGPRQYGRKRHPH
jgi:hypothetical protein